MQELKMIARRYFSDESVVKLSKYDPLNDSHKEEKIRIEYKQLYKSVAKFHEGIVKNFNNKRGKND